MKTISLVIGLLFAASCAGNRQHPVEKENKKMENQAEIYLAGGCFWGTEHFLKQINGVLSTQVGFANGRTVNPSYEEVCHNNTGHAETVHVVYNPAVVSLTTLLALYFKAIDPTSVNRQGGDRGTQYRTGIYYTDKEDLPIIQFEINKLSAQYDAPIAIEVLPLENFYTAEEYHQDYLDKNENGYCHINPELFVFARQANAQPAEPRYEKPADAILKKQLTDLQYRVTQDAATEPPFENAYCNEFREGIYVDISTGEPLFVSTDKFESGCGWPSFSKPIDRKLIAESTDTSHGLTRTEVRSKTGNAHLGHVFTDGPTDKGGLRYCINSAALRFVPKAEMEKAGYGRYLPLLK